MGDIVTGCDVLVVGGGPGGYTAAIRASQLGRDVILVEKEELGGICTNHGCIPSKALIHAANFIHDIKHPGDIGITGSVEFDFKKIQVWNTGVIKKLRDGIGFLCKKYGVEVIKGEAYLESNEKARVITRGGVITIKFQHAVLATGSHAAQFPGFPYDGETVISFMEALSLQEVPEHLVIIGAGYISIELGTMYAKLGSSVSIIQRSARILTRVEPDLVDPVTRRMEAMGIKFYFNSRPEGLRQENNQAVVTLSTGDTEDKTELAADKLLVAVGIAPNSSDLGLENTSVELDEKGFIKVDETRRTTDPGIYAVGDVTGPPLLAHKAFREGKVAAEVIAGQPSAFDNRVIPAVIFSDPEIATVGLDEDGAKQQGFDISIGRFPYRALGRAITMDRPEGFVKIVANKKNGEILGVHIVGAGASDLISEASLSIEMAAFLEDMAATIHPHPTLAEVLAEAAEVALGKVIHM